MRRLPLVVLIVLAGCGGKAARPVVSATATPGAQEIPAAEATAAATPSGPWSLPVEGRRQPLACPAASSRARWPDRVRALGGDRFAQLTDEPPQLVDVTSDGAVRARTDVGARERAATRVLACGRDGRIAVAWVEASDDLDFRLRVALRPAGGKLGAARTVDSARSYSDDPGVGDVALAFAPDGGLLVAYAVFREVRAALVSPSGTFGRSFKLGPAIEVTQLAAEIAENGRAVVAWSTYDGGEEQNFARRIYAVTRARGVRSFSPAELVHRAGGHNEFAFLEPGIRLAVAPNGRALLMWRTEIGRWPRQHHPVMLARATPPAGFGHLRKLALDGIPGDVAIRSDGASLAVWRGYGRLRALVHGKTETITGPDPTDDPVAAFSEGHPRVEWEGHASVRTEP